MKTDFFLSLLFALVLPLASGGAGSARAQARETAAQSLTLEACRQDARDNYPAVRQYRLLEQTRDYNLANAAKGWLPKVSASAGAYVYTDIVKGGGVADMLGFKMKNCAASASVTVSQTVYDGGQTAAMRDVVAAEAELGRRELDVTLYAVNERVDQLYFGILLLEEQLRQNQLLRDDLATSTQTVQSLVDGGMANQSDLDAVRVEALKAEQQSETLRLTRAAYLRMLGVFVGRDLPDATALERPADRLPSDRSAWGANRPELSYFAAQNALTDTRRKQLDASLRPTVGLFGTGLAHTKVTDLLHNGLLAAGVSVSWNISALYTRKDDIRKLDTQRAMCDSQRELFLFNNRLQNEESSLAAQALRKQIARDAEIVSLRESVRAAGEKKVKLGTESVSDLVRDINAASMARAQKAQHEIELLSELYKQRNLNNQ